MADYQTDRDGRVVETRRSGTPGWLIALLVVVALVVAAFAFGLVDIDQIKAVAAGECAVTLSNTYYLVRLIKSDKADEREAAAKIQVIFPNQAGDGAHANISGAGVAAHAPNREAAVKLLEFLVGDEAQAQFAEGNNEYPVALAATGNPELDALGSFKTEPVNVSVYGENQPLAQEIMDRAGWR